ncbi:MAG: terminase family protein [Chromatiales bacterium]|nr:terminase family protein [Chromatiales bacterium]
MTDFLTTTLPSTTTNTAPPVLLSYQQAWVADDAQLKVGEKSRRIGLTWAEASDDVLIAAAQSGSNVFYISATQDMAIEYIEACAMWARAFNQAAGEIEEGIFHDGDKEIKSYKIDFPKSGKRIVALSSRPTNLRGKQGVIVIDEAAFHNDLAAMLKAAMAMLLWGDKVRIISTHDGVDNAFNELIQDVRAGKRKGSVHRTTFRQAVEAGLYRRVCLRRGLEWTQAGEEQWVEDAYNFYGDAAAEELDVIPSQSGGAYLSMGLIETRMNPATPLVRGRWEAEFAYMPDHVREAEVDAWCDENLKDVLAALNPDLYHAFGEDFGRLGDLTVLDILEEGRDLVNRVKLQVELSNCPFEQQRQILFYIVDRLPRFRSGCLDARGNGQWLAEKAAQKYGTARIEQVMLSDSVYLEHMPRFKAALQDGTLDDIPRDVEVRDDLRALRLIDGIAKLPKSKTQKGDGPRLQRHGDSAIALFLAHKAMKREVAPIEWTEAPSARSQWDDIEGDSDLGYSGQGGW